MSVQTSHLTSVTVSGMSCQHCVNAITEELSALNGVTSVDVTLSSGIVTLKSDHKLSEAEIAAAVDEAGYTIAD
ncbi:MAG TPA: heavy-metal-associated domain-containing protein [Pseudonocardia sp.]|jgi:copper chaperone CopZ|nr:heavy-metal-associated domain-containing protein [Pseudonocardia sp.]